MRLLRRWARPEEVVWQKEMSRPDFTEHLAVTLVPLFETHTTNRRSKVPFSVCLLPIIVSANTKTRYLNNNFPNS